MQLHLALAHNIYTEFQLTIHQKTPHPRCFLVYALIPIYLVVGPLSKWYYECMRNTTFVIGEYYHIYNRGTDKRNIVSDVFDVQRFLQSMDEFNSEEPIGSIFQNSFPQNDKLSGPTTKLVNVIAYCLNPNHYHFILEQLVDGGISEFIKRLGGGYTRYFNERYDRTGGLFQGKFKSIHIDSNEYLLYLSAYVNKNYEVHQLSGRTTKLIRSSWGEYAGDLPKERSICEKNIILEQFKNVKIYERFVDDVVNNVVKKRKEEKEIDYLLIE